ncbi:MAG: NAD-dependent epimerase/dehydratase family protein, partial [Okeania sp. SIO4D6]|nr:NAD-dependent epimerase/dehydratase family protein [Okeania sp. SIO4D6]
LLEVEKVGIQDNFFELGGDSLLATKLIFQIRETFQIKIYVKTLFYSPTIVKLAPTIEEILQTGVYDKEKIDFNAEAILDLTIIPQTTVNQNIVEPQNILLTGVTGFVGAYLLDELLRKTSANIYCLIRANNTDLAKQKLKNKLEDYLLWDEKLSSRIIPVVGDLCSRFFGLPTEKFNFLAHEIDVIYHSGAWVNHIYPYTVLKSANVLGTQEILRLASETSVKPVHFISSLGVLPSSSNSESTTILESAPLTETPNLKSGYIQSKWVAEKLVMAASDRGIPTCIYRLPMITADTNTGVSNINDRICRQIKGCLQLGMVPILESKLVDNWVPVNDMSQAIVYLSRKENSLGKTFHLMNSTSTSLNHLFDWICSLDSSVKKVSSNDWVSELSNHPENVLYPYILKLEFQIEKSTEKQAEIPSQIIDTQNTNNGLKGSQIIQFTPIDEKYFETMLSYLTNSSKS